MHLYCFDFRGEYVGHIDDDGVFFGSDDRKLAQVADRGEVYDFRGRHLGRIDAQGSFFDTGGVCRCYVRNWADRPHGAVGPAPVPVRGAERACKSSAAYPHSGPPGR